jgi:hypothetical protein
MDREDDAMQTTLYQTTLGGLSTTRTIDVVDSYKANAKTPDRSFQEDVETELTTPLTESVDFYEDITPSEENDNKNSLAYSPASFPVASPQKQRRAWLCNQ